MSLIMGRSTCLDHSVHLGPLRIEIVVFFVQALGSGILGLQCPPTNFIVLFIRRSGTSGRGFIGISTGLCSSTLAHATRACRGPLSPVIHSSYRKGLVLPRWFEGEQTGSGWDAHTQCILGSRWRARSRPAFCCIACNSSIQVYTGSRKLII
jgi:hypothetical protein